MKCTSLVAFIAASILSLHGSDALGLADVVKQIISPLSAAEVLVHACAPVCVCKLHSQKRRGLQETTNGFGGCRLPDSGFLQGTVESIVLLSFGRGTRKPTCYPVQARRSWTQGLMKRHP